MVVHHRSDDGMVMYHRWSLAPTLTHCSSGRLLLWLSGQRPYQLKVSCLVAQTAESWKIAMKWLKTVKWFAKKNIDFFWGSIYKASFLVILKTCAWIILYYSSTSLYYHQKVYYTRGKPYISALSSEYLSIWVSGCWSSKGALLWLCYSCLSPPYLLLRSFSITQLFQRGTISKALDFLKTYQNFR